MLRPFSKASVAFLTIIEASSSLLFLVKSGTGIAQIDLKIGFKTGILK
jgi:hypothetical protein